MDPPYGVPIYTPIPEVRILGVYFAQLTFAQALDKLWDYLYDPLKRNHLVVTPNPEGVMQARRNTSFALALDMANLRLADGTGIVLASRWLGRPLPQRVRGVDITFALFKRAKSERPLTAFFLGAAPGVAEKAKRRMEARYPGVQVVGTQHGFFSPEEEPRILADIKRAKPDVLLVCLGMPRAEIWANKHRDLPVRLTLCVGGTLDIMSGNVKLAPPLWRKLGLEWLYRLFKQPSRFKRMLDIPRFVWAVIRSK